MNATNQNPFLKKLTSIIEANIASESFGVSELAGELNMSRSNLHRKVRAAAKVSVSQFIRNVRLEKAMEMLKAKEGNVSEVAYRVGFNSVTYFSKCFHDAFAETPGEVLNQEYIEEEPAEITENAEASKELSKQFVPTIFYYVLAVVIISIAVLEVFDYFGLKKPKSMGFETNQIENFQIAIPPFTSVSDENSSLLDAVRLELHEIFGTIAEFDILEPGYSEMSIYSDKNSIEIGKDLDVDLILSWKETGQGNEKRILISCSNPQSGATLWNKLLDDFDESTNIYLLAESVVSEICKKLQINNAQNRKLIKSSKPSENLAAIRYFQAGVAEMNKGGGLTNPFEAKKLFLRALKADSTIAQAYVYLAHIHINLLRFITANKNSMEQAVWQKNCLDTCKIFAEKAIVFDPENSWAYGLLGDYYRQTGNTDKAEEYFELSDKYEVNYAKPGWNYYHGKLHQYWNYNRDYKVIQYGLEYLKLLPDSVLPNDKALESVAFSLILSGFKETGMKYIEIIHQLRPDNEDLYLSYLCYAEQFSLNFKKAEEYALERLALNQKNIGVYYDLINAALGQRNFKKSLEYLEMCYGNLPQLNNSTSNPHMSFGFAYLENGYIPEARYHLEGSLKNFEQLIQNNHPIAQNYEAQLYCAMIHAGLNNREKCFAYLSTLKESKVNFHYHLYLLKSVSTFDKYRDTDEFKEIYNHVEKNANNEIRKTERLLKREKML
jgi:AraC-like DNA-binding protein